jgi:hypothetical protein
MKLHLVNDDITLRVSQYIGSLSIERVTSVSFDKFFTSSRLAMRLLDNNVGHLIDEELIDIKSYLFYEEYFLIKLAKEKDTFCVYSHRYDSGTPFYKKITMEQLRSGIEFKTHGDK